MSKNIEDIVSGLEPKDKNEVLRLLNNFDKERIKVKPYIETSNSCALMIDNLREQNNKLTDALRLIEIEIKSSEEAIKKAQKINEPYSQYEQNIINLERQRFLNMGSLEQGRSALVREEKTKREANDVIYRFNQDKEQTDLALRDLNVTVNLDTFQMTVIWQSIRAERPNDRSIPQNNVSQFAVPGRHRDEAQQASINRKGYVTDTNVKSKLDANLARLKLGTGVEGGSSMVFSKNDVTYLIHDHKVEAKGSGDEMIKTMVSIFLECERSKAQALNMPFAPSKIKPLIEGPDVQKIMAECKKQGIGTGLDENLTRGNNTSNSRNNEAPVSAQAQVKPAKRWG